MIEETRVVMTDEEVQDILTGAWVDKLPPNPDPGWEPRGFDEERYRALLAESAERSSTGQPLVEDVEAARAECHGEWIRVELPWIDPSATFRVHRVVDGRRDRCVDAFTVESGHGYKLNSFPLRACRPAASERTAHASSKEGGGRSAPCERCGEGGRKSDELRVRDWCKRRLHASCNRLERAEAKKAKGVAA